MLQSGSIREERATAREQLWSGEGGLQGKLTASGLLSEECEDFLESL